MSWALPTAQLENEIPNDHTLYYCLLPECIEYTFTVHTHMLCSLAMHKQDKGRKVFTTVPVWEGAWSTPAAIQMYLNNLSGRGAGFTPGAILYLTYLSGSGAGSLPAAILINLIILSERGARSTPTAILLYLSNLSGRGYCLHQL